MPPVTPKVISSISNENIRNICILAHVDHGKTTLSDSLIATNGIISSKLAGKIRYLDSREDEQQRGITMKSSGISLFFKLIHDQISKEYLINLIDSPGHVDFAGEVSTASKLCDGALILVDAVEGVCTQTHTVLRQAWDDQVRPILVINKIDRLITELQHTPMDAYLHICKILEQVNAIMGAFYQGVRSEEETRKWLRAQQGYEDELEDKEIEETDEDLYFAPDRGNVLFASAIDGWAFRPQQFVGLYASKLGIKPQILRRVLWGDFYLDPKTKRVLGHKHLKGRALKPMFVQFVLESIWAVYDAVLMNYNKEKIEKIASTLNIKLLPRDLSSKDHRSLLQTIFSQWLPLSSSTLLSIVEILPSPVVAQKTRLSKIIGNLNHELDPEEQKVEQGILQCDEKGPIVALVSKMFHVHSSNISPLVAEEELTLEQQRERRMEAARKKDLLQQMDNMTVSEVVQTKKQDQDLLIGFARLYSGTIKNGDEIYVLAPRYHYEANKPSPHAAQCQVQRLYLLMGRELQEVAEVRAGQVFGVLGLENHLIKAGTLASSLATPSLAGASNQDRPIVRCAVEPADAGQMSQLLAGLKLLVKADPSVEVVVEENGEHILCAAGELHLERCLKDLKDWYAKIEINASPPIVPFRETLSNQPALPTAPQPEENPDEPLPQGTVLAYTPNKMAKLRIRCVPLSEKLTMQLVNDADKIKSSLESGDGSWLSSLSSLLPKGVSSKDIWSFGPRRIGPNLLINAIPNYERLPWPGGSKSRKDEESEDEKVESFSSVSIREVEGPIVTGFQLATLAGPLCSEPMQGVCFIVEDVELNVDDVGAMVQLSGQVITTMAQACRNAFMTWSTRLALAMYSCDIQATSEVLGKVYAVLARRKGKVLGEDMKDGTNFFEVKSSIPVVESFGFADELRKKTSGAANPQLIFSGFEPMDQDPYWIPTTEEELEDLGEKADRDNVARKYMDAVRKRKGLFVEQKIVERAEKQRTQKR